jgi:D-alanine-D-alanine ligase
VILFDLLISPPRDHIYSAFFKDNDWEAEKAVFTAFKQLGFQPYLVGVFNDLRRLRADIEKINPDLIFNLAEALGGKRDGEPTLVAFLEKLQIPFTGNSSAALKICKNKILTRKLLLKAGVKMPAGKIFKYAQPVKNIRGLDFPVFIKPSQLESSEGISKKSITYDEASTLQRIRELQKRFKSDVLVEEFIPGRELYVSALETEEQLSVLPIRELHFKKLPGGAHRFATYQLKWDEKFRKKWNIQNGFAHHLTQQQKSVIESVAKKAFRALKLNSYARLDFRLDARTGEPILLEVNPNPSLSSYDDFARSAKRAKMLFRDLVRLISCETSMSLRNAKLTKPVRLSA